MIYTGERKNDAILNTCLFAYNGEIKKVTSIKIHFISDDFKYHNITNIENYDHILGTIIFTVKGRKGKFKIRSFLDFWGAYVASLEQI